MKNPDDIVSVDYDIRNDIPPLCSITWPDGYPVPCIAVNFIDIFRNLKLHAALHAAEIYGLSTDNQPQLAIAFFTLHVKTSHIGRKIIGR